MYWIKPNQVIGDYLRRWWIWKSRRGNIYLHHFVGSDSDRAFHDHPFASFSITLWGSYLEVTPEGEKWFYPGSCKYRSATYQHRVITNNAWTLFITGPWVRRWGFHCPEGWKYWKDYDKDGGCGEYTTYEVTEDGKPRIL